MKYLYVSRFDLVYRSHIEHWCLTEDFLELHWTNDWTGYAKTTRVTKNKA
jgi:hypothetical protein